MIHVSEKTGSPPCVIKESYYRSDVTQKYIRVQHGVKNSIQNLALIKPYCV
jgi:hypothetical protein